MLDQQDKIKVLTSENSEHKAKLVERERQIAELNRVQEENIVNYNSSVTSLEDDLRNIEAKCSRFVDDFIDTHWNVY